MTEVFMTRCQAAVTPDMLNPTGPARLIQIYPVEGPQQPIELERDRLFIGREPNCGLVLSDDSVSRRHALIEANGSTHLLTDLGSTNGTAVNDQPVCAPRLLADGDRVQFGNQIFKYVAAGKFEARYHDVVFRIMTTDGLTGIYNKRFFLDALSKEAEHAAHRVGPLCLLMMDLDKFKAINDTHGHLAGDAVLVEFAKRARAILRTGDILARYGGEEFAIVLAATPQDQAIAIAERLRLAAQATPVTFGSISIPITVSIGVASVASETAFEPSDLISQADALLYQAKNNGRNQVQYKSSELS